MNRLGFTLIELLIVVAIIGVLAAIAVPNFIDAMTRARVIRAYSDMLILQKAMEMYRVDNNAYVPDFDSGRVPGAIVKFESELPTYSKLTSPVAYIQTIPYDPFFLEGPARLEHIKNLPFFQYAGPYNGVENPRISWRRYGTIYTITSLGPDLKEQEAWAQPYQLAYQKVFSLSNGLQSSGDLYVSNQGLIK